MIDLGVHADFIIWSYAGVALVIAGLVGSTAYGAYRSQKRIKAMEDRGIRRRSDLPAE